MNVPRLVCSVCFFFLCFCSCQVNEDVRSSCSAEIVLVESAVAVGIWGLLLLRVPKNLEISWRSLYVSKYCGALRVWIASDWLVLITLPRHPIPSRDQPAYSRPPEVFTNSTITFLYTQGRQVRGSGFMIKANLSRSFEAAVNTHEIALPG